MRSRAYAMRLKTAGLLCGIVGPSLWIVLIGTAGVIRPDFSPVTNYISELGERGSSTETLVRYGAFVLTGVLYVWFAGALGATARDRWLRLVAVLIALDGVGRLGAGVFPCDPGCRRIETGPDFHRLFATIGFVSGTLAVLGGGVVFPRILAFRSLARVSRVLGAVASIALMLMAATDVPWLPSGLLEHLATVVLSLWVFMVAARVRSIDRSAGARSGP